MGVDVDLELRSSIVYKLQCILNGQCVLWLSVLFVPLCTVRNRYTHMDNFPQESSLKCTDALIAHFIAAKRSAMNVRVLFSGFCNIYFCSGLATNLLWVMLDI